MHPRFPHVLLGADAKVRVMEDLSLSREQRLIFEAGIGKLKRRTAMWRALANRPTAIQLDDAVTRLLGHLAGIRDLVRSASDEADKAHKVSAALCDALEDAASALGHDDAPFFAGEWLSQTDKMDAIARRLRKGVRSQKPKEPGPSHHGVHERLIGIDLPALYTAIFAKKFPLTRNASRPPPGTKFVNVCLARLGMPAVGDETIRTHVLNAKKRQRERAGKQSAKG